MVGRYAIHDEIASGGMASVHLGRLLGPVGFNRTVAIKRMHPHIAKDDDFVSMFIDEARLAARVRHPNVVQTLDVVQAEGELLLVMEYVHGAQLSLLLRLSHRASSPVPLGIGAAIVAGMLRGLHAAHEATDERGVALELVHRDVSPHNVMVGVDGVARVIDFGVAKAVGRLQHSNSGQLKGKAPYMAPEQIRGLGVTRRVDIFAAGVVLWETLAGKRLFQADNDAAIIGQILSYDVPPPSTLVPTIPPALDAVVQRALERNPARRFPTAREMAQALEASVPIASPAEIGEWVETIAAAELAKRTRMVATVESATALTPAAESTVRVALAEPPARRIINEPPPEPIVRTADGLVAGNAPLEADPASKSLSVVLALVGLVALAAAAVLIVRVILREPPESVPAPASSTTAALSVSASAAGSPSPSASASVAPSAPVKKSRPTPLNCNPNYYFDAQGIKHRKQHCP